MSLKHYLNIILTGAAALLLAGPTAQGVILMGWETNGVVDPKAAAFAPASSGEGIEAGSLTRGAGLGTSGTAAANTFYASGFNVESFEEARDGGHWWEFAMTVDAEHFVDLSAIGVNIRRSSNGPDQWQWGFAVGDGGFQSVGPVLTSTLSAGNGEVMPQVALTELPVLQELTGTTVTFRLYGWGGTTAAGTGSIGRLDGLDLWVSGTSTHISAIPEPSTVAVLAGLAVFGFVFFQRRAQGLTGPKSAGLR